jgi:hypothetical protein
VKTGVGVGVEIDSEVAARVQVVSVEIVPVIWIIEFTLPIRIIAPLTIVIKTNAQRSLFMLLQSIC